ncbi:hypothetical protein [Streptococcus australis]|uniref:hypothetical protein n=1 Tax=Streptococcus australis TaxID=113107 RepID=UPI0039C3ED64
MNLGTLTQFEQSENYVPISERSESSLQIADEFRDIDSEELCDVRAISHQSHVEITFMIKE